MNAERKFLLACLIFALVIYAIHAFGLFDLLTDLPHLQTLIRQSGLFGYSLYILLFIIATLFLLPGNTLAIAIPSRPLKKALRVTVLIFLF